MQTPLENDLHRLAQLAYHRLEWSGRAVRKFHRLRKTHASHPDFALLEVAYAWIFVPFTLWPIDFQGLCEVMQNRIAASRRIENALRLVIESLPPLPDEKAQRVAAAHEHRVQSGDYDAQLKAAEKYCLIEQQLMDDPRFAESWAAIKAHFDVTKHQDYKGIIRRRMISERAFRSDWELNWDEPDAPFRTVFDVFCHRWNLYGMAGDRPLLQKLTVNRTPHGTMIFIPSWWSLDPKRDLNWREINSLHRARVATRQGAKLTRNQKEQLAEAKRAALLNAEAKVKGLTGERREGWVMAKLGWKITDPRKLRRVLNRAKRLGK